ncbi:MAG: pyridoxal phosphate-dependent aminotransferase, partial [Methylococcales bacterium]|nr:pyridoxal phosphate-dependent aminotransferase [Methylococcales bacterium]
MQVNHAIPLFEYLQAWPGIQYVHQSNPQPYRKAELEAIIGPLCDGVDDELGFAPGAGLVSESISGLYADVMPGQVGVFAGAQEATFCVMQAVLNKGDKVVVITPVYSPLVFTAEQIGCDVVAVALERAECWTLNLEALRLAMQGCAMLVINFPHNPTGAMIDLSTLESIVSLCDEVGCWLLSDEVFRGLEYDASLRLPGAVEQYDKGLSIGVMSKAFAMPAIRVGWLCSQNQRVLRDAKRVKSHLSINNSLFDEQIVARVLPHANTIWQRNIALVQKNRPHELGIVCAQSQ